MEKDFSELSIGVVSSSGERYMLELISAVRDHFLGAQLIIADDGALTDERNEVYKAIVAEGPHTVYHLPYGQTHAAKANIVQERCYRPYLLMVKDFYDLRPLSAKLGIMTLINRLEAHLGYAIAGGRVSNRVSEYWLDDRGEAVTRHQVPDRGALAYSCIECDVISEFYIVRKEVFKRIQYKEPEKAGDSSGFFLDVKRAGFKTIFVPGVNMNFQGEK